MAFARWMRAVAFALALTFSVPGLAVALRGGAPLSTRFTAEDHPGAPGTLAVVGDPRGMVWVGNGDGLLRYAGGTFELIELPGHSPARALAIGPDGELYVGSYDRVGRLAIGADGVARFEDYTSKFAGRLSRGSIGNVWDVIPTDTGVLFRGEHDLLLHEPDRVDAWPAPENLRGVHRYEGVLYGRLDGVGLARFAAGRFEPIAGTEAFADTPFIALLAGDRGALVLGSDGFHRLADGGLTRVPTAFDASLAASEPYVAQRLADGSYLVGTSAAELFHVARDLTLLGRHVLDGAAITALGKDREGGAWVGTESSVMRVLLPSPWSIFGARDGLRGAYQDAAATDDALWVATTLALYRRANDAPPDAPFAEIGAIDGEVWDLEPLRDGVLAATRNGVFHVTERTHARIGDLEDVYALVRSRHVPDRVYAVGDAIVLATEVVDGRVTPSLALDFPGASLSTLVELARDELWVGDFRGAPWRARLDGDAWTVARLDDPGLVIDPEFGTQLEMLDDRVLVISGDVIQTREEGRFARTGAQGLATLVDRPMQLEVREAPSGTFAMTSRLLLHRARGSERWEPLLLDSPLARGFNELVAEPSGVLRLVTWHGVLQFDPRIAAAPKPELLAALRRVERRDGEGRVTALPVVANGDVRIGSRDALRFEFEVPSAEPGREFRYRLVGHDDGMSPWQSEPELALPRLPPGDYRLELEARLKSGRSARPLAYAFRVEPLWFERHDVQAAIAAILALVVLVATRWYALARVRKVEHRSKRLEKVIADRTRELERANLQLARLAALDGLTGVPNRRGFDAFLDEHWAACRERGAPLSLVMIDVDHFKRFNDSHGHLAGDEALRAVALELSRFASGEREILARFGGEEFAMVIDGATLDEAAGRAEYIRQHFAERAERDGLTLSIGVATLVPEVGVPPRRLIDLADAALYQAKRNGRNRVEAHRAAA